MTKAWTENKDTILGYYQARKLPLNQVILIMKKNHNFNASQRAYRQQFRLWGVFKYNRKDNQILATKAESKDAVTMPPYPSVYYSRSAKAPQGTPRTAHAQTVRPETMYSIPPMISPHAVMPSPYPSPMPTPSSNFHDDNSMGHIRDQYPYHHDTHHASSRDIKSQVSEIILDGSVAQASFGREPVSSLRLPAVSNSTVAKTSQPQNSGHRSPSAHVWNNNGCNENIDLGLHGDYKSSPEQGPGSPHDSRASQTLHTSHSPYHYPSVKSLTHPSPPFGDYSSEHQHDVKPYYGAHHHYEQDTKPRPWPSPETLPVTSASGYETHRYHLLPSPAHSQEHTSSPRGTKDLMEHISTPRTLPPSPSSLPEIIAQTPLNREPADMQAQGHAYEYNPGPMPSTLSMVRPYDTAYATSGGPPDHHSVCGIATSVYA